MSRTCWALAVGLALAAPATTKAAVITYATPGGSTLDGHAAGATATFTTSNGAVSVLLENLTSDPKSVVQNISGVQFTVTGATAGSLTSSSGTPRMIADDGSFTDGAAGPTDWLLSFKSGTFNLTALGANGPDETIVGAPNDANAYANANGSIADNKPHNSFLSGPVSFVVTGAGITSQSVVSNVVILFGTGSSSLASLCRDGCTSLDALPPGTTTAPEPASLLLLGSGLVGFAWRMRKRAEAVERQG